MTNYERIKAIYVETAQIQKCAKMKFQNGLIRRLKNEM